MFDSQEHVCLCVCVHGHTNFDSNKLDGFMKVFHAQGSSECEIGSYKLVGCNPMH